MLSCQAQKVLRALFNNKATSDLIIDLDGGRNQFFVHHDVVAAESKLIQQYLADLADDDENRAPGSAPIIRLKLPKINSPMKHPDDPPMTPDAYFELYLKYVYGIESADIDYPVRACCIAEIADYMLSPNIKDQCDDVLGEVTVSHSQDRWHVMFFFARRLGLKKTQSKTLEDVLAQFGLEQILASLQSVDAKRFKELILEIPCDEIQQLHALIRYTAKLEPNADLSCGQIVLYDEGMVACLHDVYRAISSRWRTRSVLLEVERLTDRIVFDEWARKGSQRSSSCCLYRILSQAICHLLRDNIPIQ